MRTMTLYFRKNIEYVSNDALDISPNSTGSSFFETPKHTEEPLHDSAYF